MSDEPKRRSRGGIFWGMCGITIVVAGYVLSAGPAARLCDEINPNPCALPACRYRTVYGQLFDLAERTGTRNALVAYIE